MKDKALTAEFIIPISKIPPLIPEITLRFPKIRALLLKHFPFFQNPLSECRKIELNG